MSGAIATIPKYQFSDANGRPLVGGKLYTYYSNTTTPLQTYQDEALTILNTNPVILDGRGEAVLWLEPFVQYTFVLKNYADALQWTTNDIYGNGGQSDTYVQAADYGKTGGNTIENLVGIVPNSNRALYQCISFYTDSEYETVGSNGCGLLIYDESIPKSSHNGATIISPTCVGNDLTTPAGLRAWFAKTGETEPSGFGCWCRVEQPGYYDLSWFGAEPGRDVRIPLLYAGIVMTAAKGGYLNIPFAPVDNPYILGYQPFIPGSGYEKFPNFYAQECDSVIIETNGARFKYADGHKFGSFSPITGLPIVTTVPYFVFDAATEVGVIFNFLNCGHFEIRGFGYVDGNISNCTLGGYWGDSIGWQLGECGWIAYGCRSGKVHLTANDMGLDGFLIGDNGLTASDDDKIIIVEGSEYKRCARQGYSALGSNHVTINDCDMSHTGKNAAGIWSLPGAGIDFEPNTFTSKTTLNNCTVTDNFGFGILDVGYSINRDIKVNGGLIVGTTANSLYIGGPKIRVRGVKIIGAVRFVGGALGIDGDEPHYSDCEFSMVQADWRASPVNPSDFIYGTQNELYDAPYALFDKCLFTADSTHALPVSVGGLTGQRYNNCRFIQTSTLPSSTNGYFTGLNRITTNGAYAFGTNINIGTLYLNGVLQPSNLIDNYAITPPFAFTPAIKFGGGSTGMAVSAVCTYEKRGSEMYGIVAFVFSALGSSTGAVTIQLPTSSVFISTEFKYPCIQVNHANIVADFQPEHSIDGGVALISLRKRTATGVTDVTHADFTNTTTMTLQFSYRSAT